MNIVQVTKELNKEVIESEEYYGMSKAIREWVHDQVETCLALHQIRKDVTIIVGR